MIPKYSIADLKNAIDHSKSIAGVLRILKLRPSGGNYRTINRIIASKGFDTSHFTGQGWNVNLEFKPNKGLSDEKIFVKDSPYKCSWRLRERYKKTTKICYCERCRLEEWQGHPIPLEIHHKNGDNTDNRLENLQLLCPNCHAMTSTYRGRKRRVGFTDSSKTKDV